ncbi:TRAP transporter small permease [Alkalihalobacillus sp. MEB130]|uniref:TRAP transporter small permease subunit n=1 Tax=Alkalihalobacillus sp. MEB130 TaxID=2976704 RepID=UPI0028DE4B02|nr:TRAP transporter small permease [Alkalihalobacillus sp. MEB130]MDT8860736.1 TRAP transporter small permease [Alkalihalobacillus sp. MEB130]
MTKRIVAIFHSLLTLMGVLGKLTIVMISLLILLEVISLKLFNYSFNWVLELTEYLLVFLTLFGAAWLLRQDGHIRFDLLINRFNVKNQVIFGIINSIIGFLISITITISGFITSWGLFQRGVKTETMLQLPRSLLIVIIPIGFLFLAIQFSLNIIAGAKKLRAKDLAKVTEDI